MLTGIFSTLVLKEGKQLTLEELSNEEQDDFIEGKYRSSLQCDHQTEAYSGKTYSNKDN